MKLKLTFALVLMTLWCGLSMAGTRINSLVIDNFESYTDPNSLDAVLRLNVDTQGIDGTGPWFLLEEMAILQWWSYFPTYPYANNPYIDADLIYSIEVAYGGDAASTIDPNGFVAYNSSGSDDNDMGIADDLNPQSLTFSYDTRKWADAGNTGKDYFTLGLTRFVQTMGIPESLLSGTPAASYPGLFGDVYTADLSGYDKLSFRLKNESSDPITGGTDNSQSFIYQDTVKLMMLAADLQTEIAQCRVPWNPRAHPKFLEYPGGVWRTVEFNLTGMSDRTGTGVLDLTEVAAIVIEVKDRLEEKRHATFFIDDLTLSIVDDPADINMDGAKDLEDLAALAADWLQ